MLYASEDDTRHPGIHTAQLCCRNLLGEFGCVLDAFLREERWRFQLEQGSVCFSFQSLLCGVGVELWGECCSVLTLVCSLRNSKLSLCCGSVGGGAFQKGLGVP